MAKIAELFVGLKFKIEGLAETQRASASLGRVATSSQQADSHVKSYARNLNATNERHAQFVRGVTKAAAALTAMSAAFGAVARMSVVATTAVSNFVTGTGIDGGIFQRMAFEAQQAGIGTAEVASQLKELQTARNEVLLGLRAAPAAWGVLGTSPADSPVVMLEKMRRKIQGIQDTGMARTWAMQAGLSESMFVFLRRSNQEFETLDKNLEVTAEQAKAGWELSRAWAAFTGTLRAAGVRILAEFYEPMLAVVKALKPLVEQFSRFVLWVLKIPMLGPAVKLGVFGLVMALGAMAAALGVLAGILHLAPVWTFLTGGTFASFAATLGPALPIIALVVAALVSLGLAVQDVWTYFEGGKSVLGDIIQLLKDVGSLFTETGEKASKAFAGVRKFFAEYGAPGTLGGMVFGPTARLVEGATMAHAAVRGMAGQVGGAITVTQNNNPTFTVNTAPYEDKALARQLVRDYQKTIDSAYRQIVSFYTGPVENKP